MRPEGFAEAARAIADTPSLHEGLRRAAIHQAYYAVMHRVRDHFGVSETHAPLRDRLRAATITTLPPDLRRARQCFNDLLNLRRKADYDLAATVSGQDMEDALELLEAVISE